MPPQDPSRLSFFTKVPNTVFFCLRAAGKSAFLTLKKLNFVSKAKNAVKNVFQKSKFLVKSLDVRAYIYYYITASGRSARSKKGMTLRAKA